VSSVGSGMAVEGGSKSETFPAQLDSKVIWSQSRNWRGCEREKLFFGFSFNYGDIGIISGGKFISNRKIFRFQLIVDPTSTKLSEGN